MIRSVTSGYRTPCSAIGFRGEAEDETRCTYRTGARIASLLTLLSAALLVGIWASAAHAAGTLGLEEWEAGTCNGSEAEVAVKANCSYAAPHSKFYTQAAGHPPWGLTGFKLNQTGEATERRTR